jgi:hypothetical protein
MIVASRLLAPGLRRLDGRRRRDGHGASAPDAASFTIATTTKGKQ